MKITVCIKQVPDTADIKWTENNTLDRNGVESVVNPFDLYAAETALRIKDRYDADITAISMGPKQAENALREVLAMGIDSAFLISDKYFAGSDTAATARVLMSAVQTKIPHTELIICGQHAIDGDTAQTGPSLAQNLKFALVTNVKEITEVNDDFIIVKKDTDDGTETIKVKLPAVICMIKGIYEPRIPKIAGRIKAQNTNIPVYNAENLLINADTVGIKGSPTYVKKAFKPKERENGEIVLDVSSAEAANILLNKISDYQKEENE